MSRALSNADVVAVPIASIAIGQRRRVKLGKLTALKNSIAAHGLIHPILLRGDTLVAGHRRLEACRALEWRTIPARQVERLSDDELRAIELDENTARENLSTFEMSKARLAQMRQAEADLKADLSLQPVTKNGRRGRPKGTSKPGSKRTVATATGLSTPEQARVERHVELAEQYPFMQHGDWVRHLVLDAGDALDTIPDVDRSAIAVIVDQPGIPPKEAITMLHHAGQMTLSERRQIIEWSTSDDEFVRRTATTTLADVPAPPDPGLLALNDAVENCRHAASRCRSASFKPRIKELSEQTVALRDEFRAHERKERANGNTH